MNTISKYKNFIVEYVLSLTIILIYWGGMLRKSFNADTLSHMFGVNPDITVNIEDGRYVIALFDSVLFKLGIRTTDFISLFMLLSLALIAMAAVLLVRLFYKAIVIEDNSSERRWLPLLGIVTSVSLVFLNVYFMEPLCFAEMSVYFGLAYLLSTLGVLLYVKGKKLLAVLLFLIAAMTYQYSVVYSAIILVFYTIIEERFHWSIRLIRKEIIAILITFGAGLFDLLIIKLLAKIGVAGGFRKDMNVTNLGDKLSLAVKSLFNIYKGADGLLLNIYLPLLVAVLLLGGAIYISISNKDIHFIWIFIVANIVSLVLMYIIPLMNGDFYLPGRMAFTFFLIQGLSALCIILRLSEDKSKVVNLLSMTMVSYAFIQLIFIHFIIVDRFVSNEMDILVATQVEQAIEEYEHSSGNTVTTLVVAHDNFTPDYYEDLNFHAYQINERTVSIVPITIIRYVSGRVYEKEVMSNEDRIAMFGDVNFEILNLTEQLKFDNDRAYWCIY